MKFRTNYFEAMSLSLLAVTLLLVMFYVNGTQIVPLKKNHKEENTEILLDRLEETSRVYSVPTREPNLTSSTTSLDPTQVYKEPLLWEENTKTLQERLEETFNVSSVPTKEPNLTSSTAILVPTQVYQEPLSWEKNTTQTVNPIYSENIVSAIYLGGHKIFNPNLCPNLGSDIKIIILITSAPDHYTAREALRMTWGHFGQRKDIAIAFVIGSTSDDDMQRRIISEVELYGDIIQGNFVDSYDNLTMKTLSMLEWIVRYCHRARFFLKTDDDMYINIPKLLKFTASNWNDTRKIYGCLKVNNRPFRDPSSKYYVSYDVYPPEVFPDFTTGPAYLMTMDSVKDLFLNAMRFKFFKLEDVFITGIVAEAIHISRVKVKEFYNVLVTLDTCTIKSAISIHMMTYKRQFELWTKLMDIEQKC